MGREVLRAISGLAILFLLVVSVGGVARTANADIPIHVSVSPTSVPVGKSFMVAFWMEAGSHQWAGSETATVHIRTCPTCSDIWQSEPMKVGYGLDYEVYPPGISTPGTYVALVTITYVTVNPQPEEGYASFQVVGSTTPFDFSLALSPPSVTVKQGATATFQILLTYSDPSYSGTTIDIQVSGLGPGMNYQVTPSPPTLQVSTSSSTPPGSYHITLTGSAEGVMHQAEALLMVQVLQPFDFSVSVSPAQQLILPGASAQCTITVGLVSGTSKNVALKVSGAPEGVTASLNPTSGTPSFTSILSITTTPSIAAGQYALTIAGTVGRTSHHTTFMLTIGQSPDFGIDVSPPSVTVSQGQVASYSVSITGMNGFNSQVSLSVVGAPAGVNPVFTVPSGTPDFNSVLTMSLPSNVQTGSFTLQITALGGGITKIANVILVIIAATGTQTQTQTQTSTATTGPYDILQQDNLLLVAVLVIAAAALLALLLRRRSAAHPAPPPPPANPCPVCGKPLTFVKQYDRWYCNNCKEYK